MTHARGRHVACGATDVPGAARSVWAGLLCVPVGGGPPARRPRCEPSARRVVSKPGQAPPPPTGTAARPSGPSGALHTSGAGALMYGSARRLEARPGPAAADQHRGQAPPPPTGTAARPSGPSGALRTSGACCAEYDSPRLEARPGPATAHGHRSQAFRSLRHSPHRQRWGFGSIRSWLPACRRRVAVLMVRFPPQSATVSP